MQESSPVQSRGWGSSVTQAWRAWNNSTQTMTPKEALSEIKERAEEIFLGDRELDFEWYDRVNRLLWVLTTKGSFIFDREEDRQNVLRIHETAASKFQSKKFPRQNVKNYANDDPRKDLSWAELLLQIQGRCKTLEELFIKVHGSAGRIKELEKDLKNAIEIEKQLRAELKMTSKKIEEVTTEFQKQLEEADNQLNEQVELNKELYEKITSLRNEILLVKEDRQEREKSHAQLTQKVRQLQDENETLKKEITVIPTVTVISEIEPQKVRNDLILNELRRDNAEMRKEIEGYKLEQQEVIAISERNRTHHVQLKKAEEELEKVNNKIVEVWKVFNAAHETYHTRPHGETLENLLNQLEAALKK